MNQNKTQSKSPTLEEPPTPHPSGAWDRSDFVRYTAKLEAALQKFMTVTATSDEGLTQMATMEGRAKFYERLRPVRAEAYGILSREAHKP